MEVLQKQKKHWKRWWKKHNRNLYHQLAWNNSTHATYFWWKNCSKFTYIWFSWRFSFRFRTNYQINYRSIDAFQYLHIPTSHRCNFNVINNLWGGGGGRCKEVGKKDAFLQITSPRNVTRLKEVYWDLTKK